MIPSTPIYQGKTASNPPRTVIVEKEARARRKSTSIWFDIQELVDILLWLKLVPTTYLTGSTSTIILKLVLKRFWTRFYVKVSLTLIQIRFENLETTLWQQVFQWWNFETLNQCFNWPRFLRDSISDTCFANAELVKIYIKTKSDSFIWHAI